MTEQINPEQHSAIMAASQATYRSLQSHAVAGKVSFDGPIPDLAVASVYEDIPMFWNPDSDSASQQIAYYQRFPFIVTDSGNIPVAITRGAALTALQVGDRKIIVPSMMYVNNQAIVAREIEKHIPMGVLEDSIKLSNMFDSFGSFPESLHAAGMASVLLSTRAAENQNVLDVGIGSGAMSVISAATGALHGLGIDLEDVNGAYAHAFYKDMLPYDPDNRKFKHKPGDITDFSSDSLMELWEDTHNGTEPTMAIINMGPSYDPTSGDLEGSPTIHALDIIAPLESVERVLVGGYDSTYFDGARLSPNHLTESLRLTYDLLHEYYRAVRTYKLPHHAIIIEGVGRRKKDPMVDFRM